MRTVRTKFSEALEGSVVEWMGVRHLLVAGAPTRGATFDQQAEQVLSSVRQAAAQDGMAGSIVSQTVFLTDGRHLGPCRRLIGEIFGPDLPATSYVLQRPCGQQMLSVEAMGLAARPGELQIDRHSERLVAATYNGIKWIHAAQIAPDTEAPGLYDRCLSAFGNMRQTLADAGAGFDQIVRTWLYLGDIVGREGDTQRYMELNRARTDFYKDYRFSARHAPAGLDQTVFPASTGIGADDREIAMACVAMSTHRSDVLVVPLENPLQTSAFRYSPCYGLKSPKFSRALAVAAGRWALIFISGTASITESESRFPGDPEGQTRQTLDNIEALISEENAARHGLAGFGVGLRDLALARVYVKPGEDFRRVRAICEARWGDVPALYTYADVCRPELLVEIEGIAFTECSGGPPRRPFHWPARVPHSKSSRSGESLR